MRVLAHTGMAYCQILIVNPDMLILELMQEAHMLPVMYIRETTSLRNNKFINTITINITFGTHPKV